MKTSAITLGGILAAISMVLLYLTTLVPTNTLTLLTLISFIPPIALMEKGLKTAMLVYICSAMGSLLFVPFNITLLYILFFGIYGIIKGFIERLNKSFLETVLKLLFFNTIFLICLLLTKGILGIDLQNNLAKLLSYFTSKPLDSTSGFLILCLIVQPVFLIYDYALTLLVGYYDDYIRKYLRHSTPK